MLSSEPRTFEGTSAQGDIAEALAAALAQGQAALGPHNLHEWELAATHGHAATAQGPQPLTIVIRPVLAPAASQPAAPAFAHGGIQSVYLTTPGADVHLELTVSTRCLWDFVLPSFPTTIHEQYNSLHDEPSRTAVVGSAANLLGKSCTWSLRLTNADTERLLSYQVLVRLLQGPAEVYRYENEGSIDPALKIPDAFLGATLVYSR